jgi:TolB protein
MLKQLSKSFILSVLISVMTLSYAVADISIHVAQGIDKPFPIAVVPFSNEGQFKFKSQIGQVISYNLKNSGRFQLLQNRSMPASPHTPKQINWNLWKNTDIEYMVIGQLSKNPKSDTYTVKFRLVTQLGNRVLLGKEYSNINPKQFRRLGHYISDQIYQTITGVKGYFSTKLAYISVTNPYSISKSIYRLVISDYDGESPYTLIKQNSNPITSPTWSSNGKEIAYVSYHGGRMAIYIINVSTGKKKLISSSSGINSSPSFVPHKNELIVALSKNNSVNTNLYTINLTNRKKQSKLTAVGANTAPDYSSDGSIIAFTSNKSGAPQIYTMNKNGRNLHRLTYKGKENYNPKFTPNNEDIVFMNVSNNRTGSKIAIINLETKEVNILTDGPIDKSPSISPNGQMIVYTSQTKSGLNRLKMISINGNIKINLPQHHENIKSPSWSPFL